MPIETTRSQDKPQTPAGAGSAGTDPIAGTAAPQTPIPDAGGYIDRAFAAHTGSGEAAPRPEQPNTVPAAWPEQWREEVAGKYTGKTDRHGKPLGDRVLAQLKRYASPVDAMLGGLAAQDKIRSGDYKSPLPDDATDRQKAEWRQANGIPEAPDGYDMPQIAGHQWSDADRPILSSFLTAAHEANLPQDTVDKLADWYARTVATSTEAHGQGLAQRDKADRNAVVEAYRQEWGPEYQARLSLIGRAVSDPALFPDDLGAALMQARSADGQRLANHPAFPRFIANFALGHYGDGALIGGESKGPTGGREDELVKIRNADIDRYYRERNSSGQTLADELMELRQKKSNPRGGRTS